MNRGRIWILASAALVCAAAVTLGQNTIFYDAFDPIPAANPAALEEFEALPGWSSTYDTGAGATWASVAGGKSGNCLQAVAAGSGTSARVLTITGLSANTDYALSMWIRCPSSTATYSVVAAYEVGNTSTSATDFVNGHSAWNTIQAFSNNGVNGNGDLWNPYGATFKTDITGEICVGLKLVGSGSGNPVVQWDRLSLGASAGIVRGEDWAVTPGMINGFGMQANYGSLLSHRKNHTPPFGDPGLGGSMFENEGQPFSFQSFHRFTPTVQEYEPANGVLTLTAWMWDDVESRKLNWQWGLGKDVPVRGGVMLAAPTGHALVDDGSNLVYEYADLAYLGIEAMVPTPPSNAYGCFSCTSAAPGCNFGKPDPNAAGFNPYDPKWAAQYCYQWRTATDGWQLTLNPNTGKPVPRRADFRYQANCAEITRQSWRQVRIVIKPWTGGDDDIEFWMDDPTEHPEAPWYPRTLVKVGHGHRAPGSNCQGASFQNIQIGCRSPELADTTPAPGAPPYSYEHLWYDDVLLTSESGYACHQPRFDANGDGSVDMEDFAAFQLCFGVMQCMCRCMDVDANRMIDLNDWAGFVACWSGPGIPADPACDDGLPPP